MVVMCLTSVFLSVKNMVLDCLGALFRGSVVELHLVNLLFHSFSGKWLS